ncbi:MAG: GNAT family N-acetyltransferase [Xanthomonadales bacterium]|nr:GNAT family N-acetyltransferase [Xanthomonadales bacterium]
MVNTQAPLKIRPLEANDLDAVVAIDARIAGHRRPAFFEKRLEAALAEPKDFIYIACERDGALQGYLQARLLEGEYGSSHKVAALDNIGVEPDRQGEGLGKALLDEFKAILRHKGIPEITTQADWRNRDFLGFLSAAEFRLGPRQVLECEVGYLDTADRPATDPHPLLESGDRDFSDPNGDEQGSLARDSVNCRSLTADDLDALIRIDRKITGATHAAYYEQKVTEVLDESGIRVSMVAESDGEVVGFIMARVDYGEFDRVEPNAVLDIVAVNPAVAHRLVGSALLSQLLVNLTGLRLDTVRTEVDTEQLDVLGFLLKNGFRQSQRLAFCRRLD